MRPHALIILITGITAVSPAALPADVPLNLAPRGLDGKTLVTRVCPPGVIDWVWMNSEHTQCRWIFCQGIPGQGTGWVTMKICPVGELVR